MWQFKNRQFESQVANAGNWLPFSKIVVERPESRRTDHFSNIVAEGLWWV